MTYCFDLDGTLLHTEGMNYAHSKPIQERIDKVNELAKEHTIVVQTARAERWRELTITQLEEFHISYNLLSIGQKVPADFYIDDKAINDIDFKWK